MVMYTGGGGIQLIPAPSTGFASLARSLNGTSDFIDMGTVPAIYGAGSTNGKMSFSCWIFLTALPNAYNSIIAANAANYEFFVRSDGLLALYGGNNIMYDGTGSHTLSLNTWYQVGFTLNGTNAFGYVNGALDASPVGISTPLNTSFDADLGKDPQTAGRFFQGNISDIALWDTVTISTSNMASLAAKQRANTIGFNGNMVFYLPITGASPEPDKSGNNNNGTLTGTTVVTGPF